MSNNHRTESYTAHWERQITDSEKRIKVAESNLLRIHMRNQLVLFVLPDERFANISRRNIDNDYT